MAKLASQFVALPPERRALAFAQTAARMAASSVMVEKDFWVCLLLGLLFADAELAPHLVFKGGAPRFRYEDDPVARSPVVHFEYPSAGGSGFDYLRREVELELDLLTDQQPTGQHAVQA
jgi:hypothetical protein